MIRQPDNPIGQADRPRRTRERTAHRRQKLEHSQKNMAIDLEDNAAFFIVFTCLDVFTLRGLDLVRRISKILAYRMNETSRRPLTTSLTLIKLGYSYRTVRTNTA